MRYRAIGTMLLVLLIFIAPLPRGHAAPLATELVLPATNMPGEYAIVGDTSVAYVLPSPLHRAGGFNTRNGPPSYFHARVYVASLTAAHGALRIGAARETLTSSAGNMVQLWAIVGRWLIYSEYPLVDPTGPWTLNALDVQTGHETVLDSSRHEGVRSLAAQAASDGVTVVWQSWTQVRDHAVSVIRAYVLGTGERSLLVQGGSLSTWSYDWPSVSGRYVVLQKAGLAVHDSSQILLADRTTGQIRPLTPPNAANSEPAISGDVVTWKQGRQYSGGTGVGAYDLRTGTRWSLAAADPEQPHALAGRYVAFPSQVPTNNSYDEVRLFDVTTGATKTLFRQAGNRILAGGHTLGYVVNGASVVNKAVEIRITTLPG